MLSLVKNDLIYSITTGGKMQVFFGNPAFSAFLQKENRLTKRVLSELVAIFDEINSVLVVLIVVVATATALFGGNTADLHKSENLRIGKLHTLYNILDIAVGC